MTVVLSFLLVAQALQLPVCVENMVIVLTNQEWVTNANVIQDISENIAMKVSKFLQYLAPIRKNLFEITLVSVCSFATTDFLKNGLTLKQRTIDHIDVNIVQLEIFL